MESLVLKVAAVGVAGVAAQWVAWRFRIPAIVLLLAAGLLLGPIGGVIDPQADFGEVFRPMVAIAVAIILFEGGLTLNLAEIQHTSKAVRRLVLIGAPVGAVLGALAAYYIGGLSWQASLILGGLFVVTGPTVIMPLLRQAKLAPRAASLLRWEAIVNDPVGALFAVLAYEAVILGHVGPAGAASHHSPAGLVFQALAALVVALGLGYLLARLVIWLFNAGLAPEFLKAPILLVSVLAGYEASQLVLEESGLLTVTVMGVVIANAKLASLTELRRFKETITTLLVTGVFILLTATLNSETLALVDWRMVSFVAAMLLLVRPLTIFLATSGAGLSLQERLLVGWIAPRGIVAVAVAGFFGSALQAQGIPGGAEMTAVAFLMVFATVLLHGFTLAPLARVLGLASARQSGVLIVGAGAFSLALAEKLKEAGASVLIADPDWGALRPVRQAGINTFYGEILSETAEHTIDLNPYGRLIAASRNDAYNALVCTDYGPEMGRARVFQLAPEVDGEDERRALNFTLGGRGLFDRSLTARELRLRMLRGWRVKSTSITEKFSLENAMAQGESLPLVVIRKEGGLAFFEIDHAPTVEAGDTVLMLAPPSENGEADRKQARAAEAKTAPPS